MRLVRKTAENAENAKKKRKHTLRSPRPLRLKASRTAV